MGNLRACAFVAISALAAACGDDGGATPDALTIIDAAVDAPISPPLDAPVTNYDFTCYENDAPTTAPATITLSGTVTEVTPDFASNPPVSIDPATGVTIQACRDNCQGQDDLGTTGPTAAGGMFTTPALDTGDEPLDGYLIATKTGNQTTRIYPASPLIADTAGVPVLMLSSTLYGLIGNIVTHTPGNAIVGTFVTDCANTPIPDATVSVTRNGAEIGETESAALLGPMGAGAFITSDVPPGPDTDVVISATYGSMTFRAHNVRAVADTVTTTQIKPGF